MKSPKGFRDDPPMRKPAPKKNPQLFNKATGAPKDAVYIGRGTPYGNPFHIGRHGTRKEVIKLFKLKTLPFIDVSNLKGCDLVCHCVPKACHGKSVLRKAKAKAITSFKGEYDFLSNFYPSPLKVANETYPTVEHLYQALKTKDKKERTPIRKAKTPGEAKRLGRNVQVRPNWDKIKVFFMEKLLLRKFKDKKLRKKLLATGHAMLVEGNTWGDKFWGVCNGKGENNLGKLLEHVREGIRQGIY